MKLPIRLATLCFLGLAAGCNSPGTDELAAIDADKADMIVVNANGYTMAGDALARFETLVIDDGKVIARGDASLADQYNPATTLDVGGRTVLPGLIDAHGHVSSLGKLRQTVDLAGIGSLDSTLGVIATYDRSLGDDTQWLIGRGWNQVLWTEKRFPTAKDLDGIVGERPAFLNRIDGHAAWANTAALQLAGIDDNTPDPDGGKIIRDDNGKATGVLIDAAMSLVQAVVPPDDTAAQRDHLRVAMYELAALGVTGVHDAGVSATEVRLYQELADSGEMAIRVSAMLGGLEVLEAFDGPIQGYADDLFEVTSVKLYGDGALGSRGAALIEPYSDDPGNVGLLFAQEQEMAAAIRAAHEKGLAANIHAIGDRANEMVLNAFAMVNDGKPSAFNDRIEHAQIVTLEDIKRFAELDIIASFQPTHATSDMNMAEDRVGSERILGAYAWRRMLDAGVRMAAGSDFPVEKPEMFDGLYAAVTRKDKNGRPPEGWYPDQVLTREETLAAFTTWAADSVGQGDRIGELSDGYWADFIVIDRDYFEVPEAEIWQIQVEQTWVAGRQISATR
ncbi:MAG: amidohydrolase [Pseudomonadota bacterium]